MRKYAIILVSLITTILGRGLAQAQQAAPPDVAMPAGELKEIVVTSERIAVSIQKAPATIYAFTSSAMSQLGVDAVPDLMQVTPGLTFQNTGGEPNFFMRGVGVPTSGPWQEEAVSLYVDGVYQDESQAADFLLNNLERVEVLEGPQGTLFGRNSNGGVISLVTKDPQRTPSMSVGAGYANYNAWDGNLYATTGITDGLAADIAIDGAHQEDGWGTNLYNGSQVHTGYDFSARSKWVLTASDTTKFTLIGDYSDGSTPQAGLATTRGIYPFITAGPSHVGGFYDIYAPTNPYVDIVSEGVSFKAQHDLSWAQIWSLTALRNSPRDFNGPYGGFVPPFLPATPAVGQAAGLKIYATQRAFDHTFTQEFQLSSRQSSRIKWVGGVFVYLNKTGNDFKTADVIVTKPPAGEQNTNTIDWQKTDSYSAYFQGTVPIYDDTRFTGGIRYTNDHRTIEGPGNIQNTVANQSVYTPVPGQSTANNPVPSGTWAKATYKAGLDHNFSRDTLGYLTFSTGFQSAYYNINSPTAKPVQPEYISAYELGLKSEWFDHRLRLNASVFDYYLTDLVVTQNVNGVQLQTNAAKSRDEGVDVALTVVPLPDLYLTAGIEDLDAKYTYFPNAVGYTVNPAGTGYATAFIDATGAQLQGTEKFMGTVSATYVVRTRRGNWAIASSLAHHSGIHFDLQSLNVQPSYNKLNASLTWTTPDGNWDVKLWGKNLTNAEVADFAPSNTIMQYSVEAPRTFGVEFGYHYDK